MKSILWIEDDADELEPLTWPLKDEGYTIDVAKDAVDAIEKVRKKEYDLIILDILIPTGKKGSRRDGEFVGATVLADIRKLNINIPVIIVTVVSDSKLEAEIEGLNVTKIFMKGSLLSEKLLKEINKILGV